MRRKKSEKILYLFDLDGVISLDGILPDKKLEYEIKLHHWLSELYSKGCILILVTHNLDPTSVLDKMSGDFRHFFTEIYSPVKITNGQKYIMEIAIEKTLNYYRYYDNSHYIQTPKDIIVKSILKKYMFKPKQAIFYDDYYINVECVKKIRGIQSVLVDPNIGIVI